ncbi:hypothetical protein JCM18909_2486 [Cutibacterium acnes JCM 18909]|nr:hypothetical protein JCM18909_2486 [Cutibacterium acnes JCM 18909]
MTVGFGHRYPSVEVWSTSRVDQPGGLTMRESTPFQISCMPRTWPSATMCLPMRSGITARWVRECRFRGGSSLS